MDQPAVKTSLIDITNKLKDPPCRIVLKCEYEQPSGSFKLRGMGYLVALSIDKARKEKKEGIHVFSSSGGNAGLAAAYASKYFNVPCTVVLPVSSKAVVHEKLRSLGANVVIHGNHWGEADDYLRTTVIPSIDKSVSPVYCHPFDNPLLWDGHAAFIDEIITENQLTADELKKVRAVVCSVGGGGLYNGVVTGLERNPQLKNVPVISIETHQAPTFQVSLEAGELTHLKTINTISTSLGSPYISQASLDNYKSHSTFHEVIDDVEAARGVVDFYDVSQTFTEPACGASLSVAFDRTDLLLKNLDNLAKDDIVIIVACGGSGTNSETLAEYRKLAEKK
ncbi:predicted protein [Scheffersomyces stipitis CBS 6054]|uniref:L-serine ammonia-lyase n=1 Tax=Scheffersomyces stipitis (strain ATCC 58785 / CBS 6054 / NBRC 10063 / NRRL Y-11545) TaxID=322104 RepID=A3LQ20_PICST|nr:predicted protein [Scheffersomyces stipitis CBS 6054]ABN64598.2 predicted protein [Scheffersomyces stipitis CBS 6054]KAG2736275.1 hypothetical protein G9P44_000365 [Scheffersomyces stipitis]